MYNYNQLIVLNGVPRDDISSCNYDKATQKQRVVFKNSYKPYFYSYHKVRVLMNPEIIDTNAFRFANNMRVTFFDIKHVLLFKDAYSSYLRFFFNNGTYKSYNRQDIEIEKNVLVIEDARNILNYYIKVAQKVGLKSDDGKNLLQTQFEKMQFVSESSVLAKYLNTNLRDSRFNSMNDIVIYP